MLSKWASGFDVLVYPHSICGKFFHFGNSHSRHREDRQIMARISKYHVSFQEDVAQILNRRSTGILNMAQSQTKRPPLFLPKMKLKESKDNNDKCKRTDIELNVRSFGGKTLSDGKVLNKKGNRKRWKTRRQRDKVNSVPSPGNNTVDVKSHRFSLPPINSKPLITHPTENPSSCLDGNGMPHRTFELAFNTLKNVIERSKKQKKRTKERFQGNQVVHGEPKPINEKLRPLEKTGSPE